MAAELNREGNPEREWLAAATGETVAASADLLKTLQRDAIPRRRDGSISRLRDLRRPPRDIATAWLGRIIAQGWPAPERRPLLAFALRRSTSLTGGEIARITGLPSANAVDQAVWRVGRRRDDDPRFAARLDDLEARLRGEGAARKK
jgi:hypothetical protein